MGTYAAALSVKGEEEGSEEGAEGEGKLHTHGGGKFRELRGLEEEATEGALNEGRLGRCVWRRNTMPRTALGLDPSLTTFQLPDPVSLAHYVRKIPCKPRRLQASLAQHVR